MISPFAVCIVLLSIILVTVANAASTSTQQQTTTIGGGECRIPQGEEQQVNIDGKVDLGDANNSTCSKQSFDEEEEEEVAGEASYSDISTPAPINYDELGSDFGVAQTIDSNLGQECLDRISETRDYMTNKVMVEDSYEKTRSLCENKHKDCTFWSVLGECEKNPAYMRLNCAPACQSCEMLHIETRCPLDPDAVDALYPGDVNKLFERIAYSPEYKQYEPKIVSKPPEGPWLLMFENMLSDVEAERLIELGGERGYERSSETGKLQADGTHERKVDPGRTSTNAWCIGECMEDPIALSVVERIENITGIPEPNSENLQLLRYEENQFYKVHTDYTLHHRERPYGVRILTFYMYLNDVEEGGGTNFPRLNNLTVTPKRGRAVLWPSVLDEDPNKKDVRTNHQALPVIKGVKYGANAWIHQRDFKTPNAKGCN
eukprot:scaffold3410_cov141-Cylindrotheca_fusiformis.AAC.26